MTNSSPLPNEDAHWFIENDQRIKDFGDSRVVDKYLEGFAYVFEDLVIDQFPELATVNQPEEESERRMDMIYEIIRRTILTRWSDN